MSYYIEPDSLHSLQFSWSWRWNPQFFLQIFFSKSQSGDVLFIKIIQQGIKINFPKFPSDVKLRN